MKMKNFHRHPIISSRLHFRVPPVGLLSINSGRKSTNTYPLVNVNAPEDGF